MASDKKLSEYKAYHRLVKATMIFMGLWPLDNPNFFYKLLPFSHIFVCGFMITVIARFMVENFSNLGLLTKGLGIGTSFISVLLKVDIRKKKRNKLFFFLF